MESSESDVFFFNLNFWLLKGVVGFGGIWFISWRIDYFNFAIFSWTYLSTYGLEKNMNPHKFSDLCIKKKQLHFKNKIIKLFVEKKIINFTAIFLHGNGWLNTFFHQLIKIPKVQFFVCVYYCIFLTLLHFQTFTKQKKSLFGKKCVQFF